MLNMLKKPMYLAELVIGVSGGLTIYYMYRAEYLDIIFIILHL